jgi:hypothetical protein
MEPGKRVPWLAGAPGEKAKVGTEAEALDAELERGAVAAAEALEERLELQGASDVLFDFGKLAGGEFLPARADGSVVAEATEKEFDFGEGEAHITGEADEEDAMDGIGGVAALAAEALGRGKEAALFVVADGGGVEAGTASELADFHKPPKRRLT